MEKKQLINNLKHYTSNMDLVVIESTPKCNFFKFSKYKYLKRKIKYIHMSYIEIIHNKAQLKLKSITKYDMHCTIFSDITLKYKNV